MYMFVFCLGGVCIYICMCNLSLYFCPSVYICIFICVHLSLSLSLSRCLCIYVFLSVYSNVYLCMHVV